jgi:phosphohistidine phosphatase
LKLLLIRHAEAAPGEPDDLRPLTAAGREVARALGGRLGRVDAVLTSPLLRARETAAEVARATGCAVEPDERLAPGADATAVRDAVRGRGEVVAVVAHQPDCSRIAAELTGGLEPKFAPGAMLEIELP